MDYRLTPPALVEHVLPRLGCPLHYWIGGDSGKPLIVMLHGATMDHRMFNAQVEALLPEYRVLVWDMRGHGKSQPGGDDVTIEVCVEDMLHILDAHEIEAFAVMGQSLGGYLAQYLYRRVPSRTQAMVIIGSTPIAMAYGKLEILALKATVLIFRLLPYRLFAKSAARSAALQPAVQQYALETVRAIPKHEFLRIWKTVTRAINTQGQPGERIDVPLLLLQGDHDASGTIKRDMPLWAKAEPLAEYHLIPDAGHNTNQDSPERVNSILLDFLRRHLNHP